jgi:hypothetical protein
MTLRKTGVCTDCGSALYGDDYGAAGHKCMSKATDKAAEAAATKYAYAEHNYNENFPPEVQNNFECYVDSWAGFVTGYEAGAQAERERIWEAYQKEMGPNWGQDDSEILELSPAFVKQLIFGGADEPPTEGEA